jgi:hypothetical protein
MGELWILLLYVTFRCSESNQMPSMSIEPDTDDYSFEQSFTRFCDHARSVAAWFDESLEVDISPKPSSLYDLTARCNAHLVRDVDLVALHGGDASNSAQEPGLPKLPKKFDGLVRAAKVLAEAIRQQEELLETFEMSIEPRETGILNERRHRWYDILFQSEQRVRSRWRIVRERYFRMQGKIQKIASQLGVVDKFPVFSEAKLPPLLEVRPPHDLELRIAKKALLRTLSESEREVFHEWDETRSELMAQAEESERSWEEPPIAEIYRALEKRLSDWGFGETPSTRLATWRDCVERFERALGITRSSLRDSPRRDK